MLRTASAAENFRSIINEVIDLTCFLGLPRSVLMLRWSAHDFSCCKRDACPGESGFGAIQKTDESIGIERTHGVEEVFFLHDDALQKHCRLQSHAWDSFDKFAQLVIV